MAGPRRWRWRRTFRSLHRDLGYLTAGLTVLYAISGVAVNHVEDWNPNRTITVADIAVGPLAAGTPEALGAEVVGRLDLDPADVRSQLSEGPTKLRVFFKSGSELTVDPTTGQGRLKLIEDRPLLREANALHLNDLKGWWTWIADAYAVILAFLALSGLVILKGATGLAGRGKWLFGAGLLVPVIALAVSTY